MVDLDRGAGGVAAQEVDGGGRVGVGQDAGEHHAVPRPGLEREGREVAAEHVIAGIAAVVVNVGPGRAELLARIARLWCAALDGQRRQHLRGPCSQRPAAGAGPPTPATSTLGTSTLGTSTPGVVSGSSGALSVPADAVAGELATAVGAAAGAVPGLAQAVADTSSSPASPAAIQSTAPIFRLRAAHSLGAAGLDVA